MRKQPQHAERRESVEFPVKFRRSLLDPSQYERKLSIDHSLHFFPGLFEILQDDVV